MRELPPKKLDISGLSFRQLLALDACMRCGECRVWCPVVAEDTREELTPRAKTKAFARLVYARYGVLGEEGLVARLLGRDLAARLRGALHIKPAGEDDLERFKSALYECSTCGQCAVVCPAGLDTVELWEALRRIMVAAGAGPMPGHLPLVTSIRSQDNPWQQPRSARAKWMRTAARSGEINAPPREIKKPGEVPVLYFVGCTASYDMNIRDVAVNTVNILDAAGVAYGVLGNRERCCGSITRRIGEDLFYELAQDNIRGFNELGIETLVTSCAGCFKTIRDDYPRVAKMNFEVLHITEYILRLLREGRLSFTHPVEMTITYHDPCHLGRATGVYDAPREVLQAIPGLRLVEMARHREYSRCCGAGGGLKSGFREVQHKLAERRVRDAEETGAQEFVTACPFCYQSLKEGIARLDSPLHMSEITELVVRALRGRDIT